jgi:hypothetical protein
MSEEKLDALEDYLATPEEELKAPKSMSAKGLKTLLELIKMAEENDMISSADAKLGTNILTTNPHMRLSKLFRKLSVLEDTVSLAQGLDSRIELLLKRAIEEATFIADMSRATEQEPTEGADV